MDSVKYIGMDVHRESIVTAVRNSAGEINYSTRRSRSTLPRPSWDRNPINWWPDPLQSLVFSMCFMVTMAVGAALRRPPIGSVGF
jgi:hypothetical protein